MKKTLGIFVRHILLQLLEIITSNKVAEVLIAQQHIDLRVTQLLRACYSVRIW